MQETRGRSVARSRTGTVDPDAMDLDGGAQSAKERLRSKSRVRDRSVMATNRRDDGVTDETARSKAERVAKLGQRKMNRMARAGEADRHIGATMPKHLVCFFFLHVGVALVDVLANLCSFHFDSSQASARSARPPAVKLLSVSREGMRCGGLWLGAITELASHIGVSHAMLGGNATQRNGLATILSWMGVLTGCSAWGTGKGVGKGREGMGGDGKQRNTADLALC